MTSPKQTARVALTTSSTLASAFASAPAVFGQLRQLYADERAALVRADTQALSELQEIKAALVVSVAEVPRDELVESLIEELERLARENLVLMRHLARLLGGIVGVAPATYGARGRIAHARRAQSTRGDRGIG